MHRDHRCVRMYDAVLGETALLIDSLTEIDSNTTDEEKADLGEMRIKNKRLKNERFITLSLSDSYALAWWLAPDFWRHLSRIRRGKVSSTRAGIEF